MCARVAPLLTQCLARRLARDVTRARYELASVVNHHGSTISGGHYTAFCRQRLGWFCFNDTLGARSVSPAPCRVLLLPQFHP